MIYKALRDINSHLEIKYLSCQNKHQKASRIAKDDIVLYISKETLYVESYDTSFYTYKFLLNSEIHSVNGQLDKKSGEIIIEDAWQEKFFIKDFQYEEKYYFENTFKLIESDSIN